jgi:hypothetical protein
MFTDDKSQALTARIPRISILHLMLWMLCTALYLTLLRAVYSTQAMSDGSLAIQRASSVFQGIVAGAVFTGAIVLTCTRLRCRKPLIMQPGYWLLLVMAGGTIAWVFLFLFFAIVLGHPVNEISFLTYAGIEVTQAIAYSFAVRSAPLRRWKVWFAALAFFNLLQGVGFIGVWSELTGFSITSWFAYLSALRTWGEFVLSGWIVILVIKDLTNAQRRDWLHWIGVGSFIGNTGLYFFWMLANLFIRL